MPKRYNLSYYNESNLPFFLEDNVKLFLAENDNGEVVKYKDYLELEKKYSNLVKLYHEFKNMMLAEKQQNQELSRNGEI